MEKLRGPIYLMFILALCVCNFVSIANAGYEHKRISRVVVFPVHITKEYEKIGDDIWWSMRERMTETKRFFVASKNFMQNKQVFQPREVLAPADAIILGRLLDADTLVTMALFEKTFTLRVYETQYGLMLWTGSIELHPALRMSDQLPDIARKLHYDFMSSIPYQGFVLGDELLGRATYNEGQNSFFKADIGLGTQVQIGDTVQLVTIEADTIRPLFQDGLNLEIYAEGVVSAINKTIISVAITRRTDLKDIKEGGLLRIPNELKRLQDVYAIQKDRDKNIAIDLVSQENVRLTESQKEKKPLVTSLAWLGNLAFMLLLAF
jgi:hypothetical protein